MIDVTLRAVSSFLVLGSELGILFAYQPHLPALFNVLEIGKTFCNMHKCSFQVRLCQPGFRLDGITPHYQLAAIGLGRCTL